METMAPIRPALERPRRISLPSGPTAAAEARSQVQAYVYAWDVPVDSPVAALLTSELVTNAIKHETGETVMLVISCTWGQLRVDVHDTSPSIPVPIDAPVEAEAGRGLMLVSSLATDWGWYRTSAGKAVYFMLEFRPELDGGRDQLLRTNGRRLR
jgi:anti-sigma regulatory factor (Ser/Thr protein kinase)